jgi:hypothetical protein
MTRTALLTPEEDPDGQDQDSSRELLETIRDIRVRSGAWTLHRCHFEVPAYPDEPHPWRSQ